MGAVSSLLSMVFTVNECANVAVGSFSFLPPSLLRLADRRVVEVVIDTKMTAGAQRGKLQVNNNIRAFLKNKNGLIAH